METNELLPHLFRTEYRKIVSVLVKTFGLSQMEMAEDIASDTFLTAAELWGLKGLPLNPVAWLYNVAKNKTKNNLQRHQLFDGKISTEIKNNAAEKFELEIDLSPQNINDSQLQMMFAICNPIISTEAQIGLSLRILCGFSIDEITFAFLSNKETINKRLFRAKEKLRDEKISINIPDAMEIDQRLETVLTTIYLLFSEGYYSANQNKMIRKELCLEAMRLCYMLIENKITNTPEANALLSLMCFHASRFDARINESGEPIFYNEQDATLWDADLIKKGEYFLNCAATGNVVSKFHVEAAIAYWHTHQNDTKEKWENILQLYNKLLQIEYSPIAALNRTYVLSKANTLLEAIAEAEKLNLTNNHFYFILLGELYKTVDKEKAKKHLQSALALSKLVTEKQNIQQKMDII